MFKIKKERSGHKYNYLNVNIFEIFNLFYNHIMMYIFAMVLFIIVGIRVIVIQIYIIAKLVLHDLRLIADA